MFSRVRNLPTKPNQFLLGLIFYDHDGASKKNHCSPSSALTPVHCCGKESPREKVVPYLLLRQQECCFDMLVCIEQTTNCFQLLLSAPLFVPKKPISSLCSEIGGQGSHGVCTGWALLVSPLHVYIYTCAGRQKSAVVILTTTNILSTRGA